MNRAGTTAHNPGLQRHHLLPLQLLTERCFGKMFGQIGRAEVGFDDFRANGLLLPANENASLKLGLPLHRGPHHEYNRMVIERVGRIESQWSARSAVEPDAALEEAIFRLGLLQSALRKRLLDDRRRIILNRRDPLGTGYDFNELDAMAEALWQATEEP